MRRIIFPTLLLTALVTALSGCGDNPAPAPGAPTPTPTSVAITAGVDLMMLKGTTTFGLTATYSNGTTGAVQGTWRSDNQAVASVDSAGRVTAAGSGETAIVGQYQGLSATQRVRVVPDYQGRWNGDFRVSSCTADGDFQRINACSPFAPEDLFVLTMGLSQNRDEVSGTSDFGDLPGPITGSIRTSGHLLLSAVFTVRDEDIVLDVSVPDWEALSIDNERMTGKFTLIFKASGAQGSLRLNCDLRIFAKTSATPAVVRTGAIDRKLHDVVRRAIRGR